MKVLIIDNYDSFTFNLYQCVGEILGSKLASFQVDVFRNDKITIDEIKKKKYDRIIISPGPGDSRNKSYFGVCADVLTSLGQSTPILGVCLGMQGMAYYFGGRVKRALKPMHGKTSIIKHDGKGVFNGLPQDLEVMRYHSLVADRKTLPDCLEITAVVSRHPELANCHAELVSASRVMSNKTRSRNKFGMTPGRVRHDNAEGEIMGLRHTKYPIEGVQFHPESFATEAGKMLLTNFLMGVKL